MTILTLNRKELERQIGKITDEIGEKITMFGTSVESINENEISIDVTPNRPDLLSFSGFAREISAFLGKKTPLSKYKTEKQEKNYRVLIDKSVKKVRPFTACAIVKNLKFNDERIKEIIDLQEKLHGSYGRNRKKLAIGIYPLEQIRLPIKYLTKKPEEIKFIPLGSGIEMNGRQILLQHPAGREYAHLLEGCGEFPIFEDFNKEILSMPPIINSEKTGKITEKTKEIFVECSGFSREYLQKTLNIIATALAEMGGKIYSMEIQDSGKKYLFPNLEPEKMRFSIGNVNKTLGLSLTEKEMIKCLEKMNIGYKKDGKNSFALVPCYRTDIIHEIDISEEVAIAYGYENLNPEFPKIATIGEEDSLAVLKRKISEVLIGLSLIEISTYHLSTKEKQFKNLCVKDFKDEVIEVIDSKTESNILRNSLLAQSLQVLSENPDSAYPQKIFELGKVFKNNESVETGIKEIERLCISLCHEKANFTEIKQILDYLIRILDIKYEIKEAENPSFIEGRCGEIILVNKENKRYTIGVLGEISPSILKNNKIKMPVSSLEIDIERLLA